MKKKMDPIKKIKLIYSGELLVFAAVFLVLGILIVTGVISVADWKRIAFTYVTLVGCSYLIFDFIWCLKSEKHRKKSAMIDKLMILPVALFVLVFDICMLCLGYVHIPEGAEASPLFGYVIGGDLIYLGLVYIFQAIYHYYHPVPLMLEAIEEELKGEESPEPQAEESVDNTPEDETTDE
ncbi:MAG: hypothetical protein Q4F15_04705 [Bacillota bacterium]|nr:hypothetical protein [Bacillota bacterium]